VAVLFDSLLVSVACADRGVKSVEHSAQPIIINAIVPNLCGLIIKK